MMEMVNQLFDPAVTLPDVTWSKQVWGGPLVVKGVLSRVDAESLAAGGQEGVETVLRHLLREVDTVLALLGRPRLSDLDPTTVVRAEPAPPRPAPVGPTIDRPAVAP